MLMGRTVVDTRLKGVGLYGKTIRGMSSEWCRFRGGECMGVKREGDHKLLASLLARPGRDRNPWRRGKCFDQREAESSSARAAAAAQGQSDGKTGSRVGVGAGERNQGKHTHTTQHTTTNSRRVDEKSRFHVSYSTSPKPRRLSLLS